MTANILIIDDITANVKLLEAKLFNEYYNIFTSNSGSDALVKLSQYKIDVILLDVMMPNMDGFELCNIIKKNIKTINIPVIMVTSLSDIEDRIKGLEAGADEFITKPIDDIALFTRIKSVLRIKTIIDELILRNRTNVELGMLEIELENNFTNNKLLLINENEIEAQHIATMINTLFRQVMIISDVTKIELNESFVPDVIIISCQMMNIDPLRIVAKLKAVENLRRTIFMMSATEENIAIVIKGMNIGINDYFCYPIDKSELIARMKTQLRKKQYQDKLRADFDETIHLSIKDGLTNLFNRHYFDIHIKQLILSDIEHQKTLWLMMIDIDHFKQVNDKYGHQAGDELLFLLANILKNNVRITDIVARYGGEEFAILAKNLSREDIDELAERIRSVIEKQNFVIENAASLKITISTGISKFRTGDSVATFIKRADNALYQAKKNGRNNIVNH
jgi:two-component system cell cycle response regulator